MKIMKTIIILLLILYGITLFSCSTYKPFTTKLDGSTNILFKEGDVIYFVRLDTTCITFHCTDDSLVKKKERKNINLPDYTIDIKDTTIKNNIFNSLENQILNQAPSLKQYFCNDYNEFANDLSADLPAMSKYQNKHLVIKEIEWDEVNDMLIYDKYYTSLDSLALKITVPGNINEFCSIFKKEYPDAKYVMINSHVYLTYNILKGRTVEGYWAHGVQGMYIPGYTCDDGYIFAPLLVVDINNAKLLSVDIRWGNPMKMENIIKGKHHMEEEAQYYKLYF